jgi:hypothetical protein
MKLSYTYLSIFSSSDGSLLTRRGCAWLADLMYEELINDTLHTHVLCETHLDTRLEVEEVRDPEGIVVRMREEARLRKIINMSPDTKSHDVSRRFYSFVT